MLFQLKRKESTCIQGQSRLNKPGNEYRNKGLLWQFLKGKHLSLKKTCVAPTTRLKQALEPNVQIVAH